VNRIQGVTPGRWLAPLLGLLALPLASCNDVLDENPVGVITPTNFFRSESDAITAINGAYQILHDDNYLTDIEYFVLVELPTPQITTPVTPSTHARTCWDTYLCNAGNGDPGAVWAVVYRGINDANQVIDNVPSIPMNEEVRARIVGEAKFLRAFHYFNLVRLFGGVPLWTSATGSLDNLARPRASADSVYGLIIQDLTEAQAVLPPSYPASDYGRATQGAAQTLLAKVYLQRGIAGKTNPFGDPLYWPTAQVTDLPNAIAELRKVVGAGIYQLVANYGSLWNEATERNSEVVWSVQNIHQGDQGSRLYNFLNPAGAGWGNAWTNGIAELPFYQSYEAGDVRREVSWVTEFVDTQGNVKKWDPADPANAKKFPNPGPNLAKYLHRRSTREINVYAGNPNDFVVLRYADVLLMLAEALNEQNGGPDAEAYALVDQVRARAGLPPLAPGMGYAEFRQALYHERQWELTQEQHGWYDAPRFWDLFTAQIVRHSQLGVTNPAQYPVRTVPQAAITIQEPRHRLKPIPQGAMDRNAELTQNPGWEG